MTTPTSRPEQPVDLAHPLGVARREVVVDGDEVHALAAERVEVDRQRRHEGLAFAGLHLGDPAEVQRRPAHQLHVVVPLADHPHARASRVTANASTSRSSSVSPLARRSRNAGVFACSSASESRLQLGFECVDLGHQRLQSPDLFALASAKELVENAHETDESTGGVRAGQPTT